ncbi:helix-turn-helix transcriptional regulator [Streptomyces sp. H27-H1]|uniref:response regulator transcription factor n=1 Tax=Streptomyces sp. H27-H1 TaxID=2996461 RepID=UPI002270A098|nr:helix-turn-helix transcriptional regulator [Streptomyces sp. H27-H1]MCY0931861.1 helix-turn-helix transcriptional regulator [Streptomyces sp. H27-H1]
MAGHRDRNATLTPRERETPHLLVEGLSNKLIARRLRISEHGAKRLVANVLAKMNCPNRTQAARDQLRVSHPDWPVRGWRPPAAQSPTCTCAAHRVGTAG